MYSQLRRDALTACCCALPTPQTGRTALQLFVACLPAHRVAISTAARFGDAVDAAVGAVMEREAAQHDLVKGMDERIQTISGLTTEAVASVRCMVIM